MVGDVSYHLQLGKPSSVARGPSPSKVLGPRRISRRSDLDWGPSGVDKTSTARWRGLVQERPGSHTRLQLQANFPRVLQFDPNPAHVKGFGPFILHHKNRKSFSSIKIKFEKVLKFPVSIPSVSMRDCTHLHGNRMVQNFKKEYNLCNLVRCLESLQSPQWLWTPDRAPLACCSVTLSGSL